MRDKLANQREKISELETQAAKMEQELKKAEHEQLGYLAKAAADVLDGGMAAVIEVLQKLAQSPDNPTNFNQSKEGDNVEETDENEEGKV